MWLEKSIRGKERLSEGIGPVIKLWRYITFCYQKSGIYYVKMSAKGSGILQGYKPELPRSKGSHYQSLTDSWTLVISVCQTALRLNFQRLNLREAVLESRFYETVTLFFKNLYLTILLFSFFVLKMSLNFWVKMWILVWAEITSVLCPMEFYNFE